METHFRLYSDNKTDFDSSIFDLISGDKETKQTKGLAYIFSQYSEFLFDFLDLQVIRQELKRVLKSNIDKDKITAIEISAERVSVEKKRADIVIKIDKDRIPFFALIIEAKSIKTSVNQQALSTQIKHYLDPIQFPDLVSYSKIGVVLTKYNQIIPEIANINWDHIVQLLSNFCKKICKSEIINQYLKFLIEIDKSMKYYEKEVLSIPAGKSFGKVQKFRIYACPDTKNYNYRRPLFVTFRQSKGGAMELLYKIEEIIIMNPTNQSEIETLKNSLYPDNFKKRIIEYLANTSYPIPIDYNERFYILSETEIIKLNNNPKPQRNNAKFIYYTLTEILTNTIVKPESQQ